MTGAALRGASANRRSASDGRARVPVAGVTGEPAEMIERLPVGVFETDADGSCVFVNARWCEYAGMTPEDALGSGWILAIHPDDRDRVMTEWRAAVRDRRELQLEFRVLRPDGRTGWLSGSAVGLPGAGGAITGFAGTVVDITAAVEARQELADERRFVDRVLDIAGSLVCVLDPEGRILRFNRACEVLTGYTFDEVRGRPFYDFLMLPEEIEPVKEALGRLRAGEPPAASENYWIARDGQLRLIAWLDTCFFDEKGSLTHIVSTGLDITDERRAQETLTAVEPIGTEIAKHGPTAKTLAAFLRVLAERMGYRHLAVFLRDEERLTLGAHIGYPGDLTEMDPDQGIVGRAFRTGKPQRVDDVRSDPDYVEVDSAVTSKIDVPLSAEGMTLGVLSIAGTGGPLGNADMRLALAVAERLAVALVLGRAQQSLADRARLFGALNDFARIANSILGEERLAPALLAAAAEVVPAEVLALVVLEEETGRYHVHGVHGSGIDPAAIGGEIRLGEGATGRSISSRAVVVDRLARTQYPRALRRHVAADVLAAVAVPLIREGVVLGALLVGRTQDLERGFSELEREILTLIGTQAALSLANAHLLAEVHALAIRDALTGLYNRRHFDEALEHVLARWVRQREDRRPVAAIMFDLDRFGQLNRDYGHQAGDAVLRAFAGILQTRFRSADLIARYGGEEFVAILEGSTRDDALAVAEDVRRLLRSHLITGPDGTRLRATVSAGCAEIDPIEPTREALLRTADVGLFMAKRNGRDQVVAA